MKQLATIAVVVGALSVVGAAAAKPTGILNTPYRSDPAPSSSVSIGKQQVGMTPAEYRALILRSEALNQKYGLGVESPTLERGSGDRFSAGNPTKGELVASPPADSSTDFAWSDTSIGAGAVLGALALAATGIVGIRHRGRLGTS